MVERGGLDYPIRVSDEFSKNTKLFRQEISASKKEFREFQKAVSGQRSVAKEITAAAKATRELARAEKDLANATKSKQKPLTEEEQQRRRIAQISSDQIKLEREAVRLRTTQAADRRREIANREAARKAEERAIRDRQRLLDQEAKQRGRSDPRLKAEQNVTRELFKQKVLVQEIALLRKSGRSQITGGDILGGEATLRRADQLEKSLKGSARQANNIFFTFRRLVGTLAIFTAARQGVQAFNDLVAAGIRFNDTIEVSTLGVAGLVATLGDVRNELGQSVSSAEELDLALGLARGQIALLRQDSLRTVATFEQLLDTFQVSVGPGLAAGLNLDEVRQLTVDISQAASALGVPQNQLAEEVRSLLSGTIQARTTRIATALGISNADIRRLKETGELFTFLEEEFSSFADAAERQSRETLSGISTLVRGLVQEVLGNAAEPLFAELVLLGNQLFDTVLSITDEAGNIRPNPEVVAAFREIFDGLRAGVQEAREFGEALGFEGLQTALGAVGTAIEFIVGFAEALGDVFVGITDAVGFLAEQLGSSVDQGDELVQNMGKFAGFATVASLAWKQISLETAKTVGKVAAVAAAFGAAAKAVEFILEKIFGVNLNIRDTIELVVLGLAGAFTRVVEVVGVLGEKVAFSIKKGLEIAIGAARSQAAEASSFIQSLFGNDEEAQRLLQQRDKEEVASLARLSSLRKREELEIKQIRADAAASQKGIEEEINKIIGKRAGEQSKGQGFDAGFDARKAAEEAAAAATAFVSTADKPISELAESLVKVNDQLRVAQQELEQAGRSAGLGGAAGEGAGIFGQAAIANSERLRKIRTELAAVEEKIVALRAAGTPETDGALVSALRDEEDLRGAINESIELSNQLAATRAALAATTALPALREESALLAAQVAQQRALAANDVNRVEARQAALVAAQAALDLARTELAITQQKNAQDLAALQAQAASVPPGAERDALDAQLEALETKKGLEEEILALQLSQLQARRDEADLVANGGTLDGLERGLETFAQDFSSTFQAGVNIAMQSLEALSSFAASAISDAFDPSVSAEDARQKFAQFLKQLSVTILNELTKLAVAKALLGFGFGGGGGVGVGGLAKGGVVPTHWGRKAQGLAKGGKPSHIPASDTVPAWLTPGEFVVRKSAVDAIGLRNLEAMNGGNMQVVGSAAASAAPASTGMAAGGLVSDQIAAASNAAETDSRVVLPAVVASERDMDLLANGGRAAMMAFMQDNAGDISTLLDRGAGRG